MSEMNVADLYTKEIVPRLDKNMTPEEIAIDLNIDVEQVKKEISDWTTPFSQREGPELFKRVRETIAKHFYLDKPWHNVVASLFVFESKCSKVLPVVFYLYFGGQKGSGKTNILDLLRILTKGVMCENISVKALAETMRSAPAVFIDEIEAERGDLTDIRNAMLRQGYKKTAAPYTRWDIKTDSPIEVPIYGPKAGTYRGTLKDDALLDRGFVIPTAKAQGTEAYSYVLMNFWPDVGSLPQELDQWGKSVSQEFTDEKLRKIAFSDAFKAKVSQAVMEIGANRESELVSMAMLVAEVAGIDIIKELHDATASRPASDESIAGDLEELQQVITDMAVNLHQTLIDKSPVIRFKQSEVRKAINKRRKDEGERPIFDRHLSVLREEIGINRSWLQKTGNAMYWDLPEQFVRTLGTLATLATSQNEPGQQELEGNQGNQVSLLRRDFNLGIPYDELVKEYGQELVEREKIPKIGGR